LRLGVVGVAAGVFALHRTALDQRDDIHLVGVCDVQTERGQQRASELGCPFFPDHRQLVAETQPDAVVVLTPHPLHAPIAVDCLESGAHVLVEKPMAAQVAQADRMVEAAGAAGRLLAVSFQHRHRPEVRAARQLIQSGRLGEIQRVQMLALWTRTARYYSRAAWRGTWAGEGGGVLMNQAAHNLDLICHLAGQPVRVLAWNRATLHAIETEDTCTALLEWSNGALGTLYVTTAQVGGEPERLEIVGTRGTLEIWRGRLEFMQADADLRAFVVDNQDPFAAPALHAVNVELPAGSGDHAAVYANFLQAIQGQAPLACDGAEARMSLELANALIASSQRGQPVGLPLDRSAYSQLLDQLACSR
jgi:predicted dehydrogenase